MSLKWLVKHKQYERFCERVNVCENEYCGDSDYDISGSDNDCHHPKTSYDGEASHLSEKTVKYLQEIAATDFMVEYFKRGLLIGSLTVPMFLCNKFVDIDRYIEEGNTETLGYVAEELGDDRRSTLLLTLIRTDYCTGSKKDRSRQEKYIRDTCLKLIKSGKSNCLYSVPYSDSCILGTAYYLADEYGETEIATAIRIEYSWSRRRYILCANP